MKRTRTWLRDIANIDLGARALEEGIHPSEIQRQEDTVLRACDMLDLHPGIIIADEVGMGKTFEALGIAAVFREQLKSSRIVVITPGPDLNRKWEKEFERFSAIYDFKGAFKAETRLDHFISAVRSRKYPIVIAPVTMFASGRSQDDKAYILSLFGSYLGLHGLTINALFKRFEIDPSRRINPDTSKFLRLFDLNQISQYLDEAFSCKDVVDVQGLADIYEREGLDGFLNLSLVNRAIDRARFVLSRSLMPKIDLLIVDEAHKLKNTDSLRARAMRRVFNKRFDKALFLTATPFQLGVDEIKAVFQLFGNAITAPDDLLLDIETLLTDIREYQVQYTQFQSTWMQLDAAAAKSFELNYLKGISEVEDPNIQLAMSQFSDLKRMKNENIEPGFRKWMLRSLRKDKRKYRRSVPLSLPTNDASALPFLIYERFIAEIFRYHDKTHKAAAEINMVSSFPAARTGHILSEHRPMSTPSQAQYQLLLRTMLSKMSYDHENPHQDSHVKVERVVTDSVDAALSGEKTLIFCARTETLHHVKNLLDQRWADRLAENWEKLYPGITPYRVFGNVQGGEGRGLHYALQSRFGKTQDALYLALREPYLLTLFPNAQVVTWAKRHLNGVMKYANELLLNTRVGKTSAERLDYQLAKRCVEKAALQLWSESSVFSGTFPPLAENILEVDYINCGLDLVADSEFEKDPIGEYQPQKNYITQHVVKLALGLHGSIWDILNDELSPLDVEVRVRLVEQLGRYLTFRQVPFLTDLLKEFQSLGESIDPIESYQLLKFLPKFWKTKAGSRWIILYRSFLKYFITREESHQKDIMEGPLRTKEFARHTATSVGRERLREAFNTPLFPMVLVANEVMQEGLDLHKNCRRIIHHDLAWNPAQIEQRVGRIDRHGSLLGRLREVDPKVTLDIFYPLIKGTIDERIYSVVKEREKWLEFLLGATPNFEGYNLNAPNLNPLPDIIAETLKVDLTPERYPD